MYEIVFLENEKGKKLAKEYIDSLNPQLQARAIRTIDLLSEFGTQLPMPYARPLGNGLYELRICFAGTRGRIFYFFIVDRKAVLISGFTKNNCKEQNKEIQKSREYKREYERKSKQK